MAKCLNCQIEVLDDVESCPLCRAILEPTEEVENMYPNVRSYIQNMTFYLRVYLFCAILAGGAMLLWDFWTDRKLQWSIIAAVGLLYVYIVWQQAVLGRTSYKNKLATLCVISALFIVGVDISMGYEGWSVSYVIPAGILLIDLIIICTMLRNRRNWQSYMMAQIWMILCSLIICGICYTTGKESSALGFSLAFVALAASLLLFLGTLIIGDRRARTELKRRFHRR